MCTSPAVSRWSCERIRPGQISKSAPSKSLKRSGAAGIMVADSHARISWFWLNRKLNIRRPLLLAFQSR